MPGAVSYDIRIDDKLNGVTGYRQISNNTQDFHIPAAPLPQGKYQVLLRAVSADGTEGHWSPPIAFNVVPQAPELVPITPSFSSTPTLRWNPVPGALNYIVSLQRLADYQYVLVNTLTADENLTAPSIPDGRYRWWVQAHGVAGLRSAWSVPNDFVVGGVFTSFDAVHGASRSDVTLRWSAIGETVRYDLWITTNSGAIVLRDDDIQETSLRMPAPLPPGTYRAWVRAIGEADKISDWFGPLIVIV